MSDKNVVTEKFVFSKEERHLYKNEIRRINRNPAKWKEGNWLTSGDKYIRSFSRFNKQGEWVESIVFENPLLHEEKDLLAAFFEQKRIERKERRKNRVNK